MVSLELVRRDFGFGMFSFRDFFASPQNEQLLMAKNNSAKNYQIKFGENDVVRVLHFERAQDLPSAETLAGPEQAQGSLEELVHRVDLFRPPEDFLPAPAAQRLSLELDLADASSNLAP